MGVLTEEEFSLRVVLLDPDCTRSLGRLRHRSGSSQCPHSANSSVEKHSTMCVMDVPSMGRHRTSSEKCKTCAKQMRERTDGGTCVFFDALVCVLQSTVCVQMCS